MEMLGGVEEKVVGGMRREKERDEKEDLEKKKVEKTIKKLNVDKAVEIDGLANKIWKFGGEVIRNWIWGFCNRVWKEEEWPER